MIYILIVWAIFIGDYYLKEHFDRTLELKEKQPLWNDRIILNKLYNKGAAMSILKDRPELLKCITGSLIASLFLTLWKDLREPGSTVRKLGLAFTVGGALSNLYDRVIKSYVVDYFSFGARKIRHIVFNISDMFIFLGSILILISYFFKKNSCR